MTDMIGFAYAAIVAVGGIMGYVKAGKLNFNLVHCNPSSMTYYIVQ